MVLPLEGLRGSNWHITHYKFISSLCFPIGGPSPANQQEITNFQELVAQVMPRLGFTKSSPLLLCKLWLGAPAAGRGHLCSGQLGHLVLATQPGPAWLILTRHKDHEEGSDPFGNPWAARRQKLQGFGSPHPGL